MSIPQRQCIDRNQLSPQGLTDHGRRGPLSHGTAARSGVAGRCYGTNPRGRPEEIQRIREADPRAVRELPQRL